MDDGGWYFDVEIFGWNLRMDGWIRNELDIFRPGWDNEEF